MIFDVGIKELIDVTQGNAVSAMIEKYFRLSRKDMAFFQFIIEGYEGMATVTAVAENPPCVRVSTLRDRAGDMDNLIAALQDEIALTEIEALSPENYCTGEKS